MVFGIFGGFLTTKNIGSAESSLWETCSGPVKINYVQWFQLQKTLLLYDRGNGTMYLEFARGNIYIYIARYHSHSSRYSSYFNIEKHKKWKRKFTTLWYNNPFSILLRSTNYMTVISTAFFNKTYARILYGNTYKLHVILNDTGTSFLCPKKKNQEIIDSSNNALTNIQTVYLYIEFKTKESKHRYVYKLSCPTIIVNKCKPETLEFYVPCFVTDYNYDDKLRLHNCVVSCLDNKTTSCVVSDGY